MKNQIFYEWDYETVDTDGDILDHNHADRLEQYTGNEEGNLVLIRNAGNEAQGLAERYWAYVKDGQLPEFFEDAAGQKTTKVPAKFQKEFKTFLNRLK